MHNIKYLIKRVIIGVSVLLLYRFFCSFLIINVSALESNSSMVVPDYICNYNTWSDTCTHTTPTQFTLYEDTYYGVQYGSTTTRERVVWGFNNSFPVGKSVDISANIYVYANTNSSFGIRGYIKDSTGFINSCELHGNGWNNISTSSSSVPLETSVVVSCKDVTIQDDDFQFYLSNINTQSMSVAAISPLSIKINSQSAIASGVQQQVQSQNETNNTLNDTNVSDAQSESSSFFNDFSGNSHGLSGVISAPLRLIRSLSTSSCSPLSFPLPFVENNVSLPCMQPIYTQYFGSFFTLYQLITTGLIGYWVVVKCFARVKGLQNPEDDRIEVFDL